MGRGVLLYVSRGAVVHCIIRFRRGAESQMNTEVTRTLSLYQISFEDVIRAPKMTAGFSTWSKNVSETLACVSLYLPLDVCNTT